jgi:EpsI family protein
MAKSLSYLGMLLFMLFAASVGYYLRGGSEGERLPPRTALSEFPEQLEGWRQIEARNLGGGQIRELKADDLLSRTYTNDQGAIAYLFIAFYASQRHRQTMHSPQNCLPGAGWGMSNHRIHSLDEGRDVKQREINEYLIEKDGFEMLAFYWYHGRGRVVASDYWGRFYTVKDAIILGRTDGALVRVIIPFGKGEEYEARARIEGLKFSRSVLGALTSYSPD